MVDDPEISAMGSISKTLAELEEDAAARVVRWAADRYGVSVSPVPLGNTTAPGLAATTHPSSELRFECVADLYDAAKPRTDGDKAAVVGYWFQAINGETDFTGQQVNGELRDLGQGVTNITSAFNDLMKRSPTWAMQIRKSGKTKQARKKYKLTRQGIVGVEDMLKERRNRDE